MIKYLKVLPIAIVLSLAFAVKATPNSFSLHEEISYDGFGIVNRTQKGSVELRADESRTIKVDFTAKAAKACRLKLKPNVPDVLSPEIKIIKSNVPITSNFTIYTNNVNTLEIEVEIRLNPKIDMKEVAERYDVDISRFLESDDFFDSATDGIEIQKIVSSINRNQSILELIENIKDSTKNAFQYSENETNFDISESLNAGIGDCDDYARLFVAISRSLGIPARVAFNSNHMWAEVLMPLENGSYKWVVVDPSDSEDNISYLLSLDLEPMCENYVIEDEVWTFE